MTREIRNRALKALRTAKSAGEKCFFPMCFVCGEHVFFTYMAAYRQQLEYRFIEGITQPIEIVRTPFNEHVNWDIDQRGDVQGGEIFPSIEYRNLICA